MASAVEAGGGPTSYGSTGGVPRTSFAALPKASVAYHTPLVASEASSSGGLALRRGTQVRARTLGLTVPRGSVAVRAALTMKSGPLKTTAAAIHVTTPGRIGRCRRANTAPGEQARDTTEEKRKLKLRFNGTASEYEVAQVSKQ